VSQPQPSAQPGRDGPIKVLLADDQALVRAGFKVLLDVEDDVTVVGEAADGAEAVRLARATRPAVVLMDIRMPVLDGLEATRQIAATRGLEGVRVLILTTYDTDVYVFEALQAGASGFLLKDSGPAELLHAIRVVAAGEALLAPRITRRLIAQFTAARAAHQASEDRLGRTDPARARGAGAGRPGAQQPGDRRGADGQQGYRADPCQPRHGQARRPRPCAAGGDRLPDRPGRPGRRAARLGGRCPCLIRP
jgi:DNA-binding NarL/FixJ family response regulator